MKTPLLLAVLLAAAAPACAARHARRPRRAARRAERAHERPRPRAAAKAETAAPSAAPATAMPPRDDAALASFGAALIETPEGLLSAEPARRAPADDMGLRAGDLVLCADRAKTLTRAQAAQALERPAPEERSSLIVRRGLEVGALTGAEVPAPAGFARGRDDLSARERDLARGLASRADAAARDAVKAAAPLSWSLDAGQSVWVRFPHGLKGGPRRGDAVEALTSSGLTTDASLDFLAVPPGSRLRGRVLESSDDGQVRAVRLVFDELTLAGGHAYPVLAYASAVTGPAADLARVGEGGTLAVAAPPPPAAGKKPSDAPLLDAGARLRLRFADPVTIFEPPSYWRAGPGLWLRTVVAGGKSLFQVARVTPGRAAADAGVRVGDLVDSVGGKDSARLTFDEAVDRLYGAPGSVLKLQVERGASLLELKLTRGVRVENGRAAPLPLPFRAR